MYLHHLFLENFTVFQHVDIDFSRGINVFIGENGMGKTHVLKVLYSACQAVNPETSFARKLVGVFRPDGLGIHRLVRRTKGGNKASLRIVSDKQQLEAAFTSNTPKWQADVSDEERWEKQPGNVESTFIPAKEILSNAYNLSDAVYKGNVEFDDTYLDIIAAARIDITRGPDTAERKRYLSRLQDIMHGRVAVADERFYLKPGNQARIEFNLVAEGIRKIALLWQLVKNGTLEKGAVLFWDEPEYIPVLVDLLLELQRNDVQVFLSTHDYILAKYFEIRKTAQDRIQFHSLYQDGTEITVESKTMFSELEHNAIVAAFDRLMDDVYNVETKA